MTIFDPETSPEKPMPEGYCNWCREAVDGSFKVASFDNPHKSKSSARVGFFGGLFWIDFMMCGKPDSHIEMPINFCPNCGRRFTQKERDELKEEMKE